MEEWIGRLEVVPIDSADPELEGVAGAFVQVVALAESEEDFISIAKDALREGGFNVISADYVEALEIRLRHGMVDDYIIEGVEMLGVDDKVFIGDFHAWGH